MYSSGDLASVTSFTVEVATRATIEEVDSFTVVFANSASPLSRDHTNSSRTIVSPVKGYRYASRPTYSVKRSGGGTRSVGAAGRVRPTEYPSRDRVISAISGGGNFNSSVHYETGCNTEIA